MLHVSEVDAQGKAKIVNKIVGLFRKAYYPGRYLALDEMIIDYRLSWTMGI